MSQRSVDAAWMSLFAAVCMAPGAALAAGYDPYAAVPARASIEVDMAAAVADPTLHVAAPQAQPDLRRLEAEQGASEPRAAGKLPAGWVQMGEVVQRDEVAFGLKQVDPEPLAAWEDIEGNQYPRKHTLFLNFNGGMMFGGEDNSAESKSALARAGEVYPPYGKGEMAALAIIQRVQEDMSALGVRIVYKKRPSKMVPYTMVMIGGQWQDTNIDSPAGGVAPGTDCEARGQRHVVYVFDNEASTVGQEAAHAWGLDHTMGGDRIMSYQFGNNKHFGDNCQALCEAACQGPGTIGCRLVHEKYCGEGSEQQNDLAELNYIFGGPEPDTEPPQVKITAPEDGLMVEKGASLTIVGELHDNYGGLGWKLVVKQDGKVIFDEVDYDKILSWHFSKMPVGEYEVTLTAEDHADHVVSDTIRITVGVPAPTSDADGAEEGVPTEGGGSAEGGGSEGGGSGGSGGSEASGEGSDSAGQDEGGCRISRGSGGGSLALLVPLVGLGLGLRARRRRA